MYTHSGRVVQETVAPVRDQASVTMFRVFRDELDRYLIDEAQRLHPQSIFFHFEESVR